MKWSELKWYEKLFYIIIFAECAFALLSGILSAIWLLKQGGFLSDTIIYAFSRISGYIALFAIPIETAVFFWCGKFFRDAKAFTAQRSRIFQICMTLAKIMVASWFAHILISEVVIKSVMRIEHASDLYMFFTRPGSYSLLLMGIALEFSRIAAAPRQEIGR